MTTFDESAASVERPDPQVGCSYEAEIQPAPEVAGLTVSAARKGDRIAVLHKALLSSHDDADHRPMNELLRQFPGLLTGDLNRVLIVIRGDESRIYRVHPLSLKCRAKKDVEAGRFLFEQDLLDVVGVNFEDAVSSIDVQNGDKIVWLFRIGWSFGLYFDLSGKSVVDSLWVELGDCYRMVAGHSLHSFMSSTENLDRLLDRGWFPFIQLNGDEFESLLHAIAEDSDFEIVEEQIVEAFSEERIASFTEYWWRNPLFEKKREVIEAALSAYFRGSRSDVINCIKNLVGEIEGIVRLDYFQSTGHGRLTTAGVRKHLTARATERFSGPGSRALPQEFALYLERVVFRGFDLERDDLRLSRHSASHGVAPQEAYRRSEALRLILVLDQICFFLGAERH